MLIAAESRRYNKNIEIYNTEIKSINFPHPSQELFHKDQLPCEPGPFPEVYLAAASLALE